MGFGFWVLDFGFWILDFGFWNLNFGSWISGFGFWIPALGFFLFMIFRPVRAVEMEEPTKAQHLSILQCLLLFRRPCPRPPGFARFTGAGSRLGFEILGFGFRTQILDLGFWT